MKKLLWVLLALFVFACNPIDTTIENFPGFFSDDFVQTYTIGTEFGACLEEGDELPQHPAAIAMIYNEAGVIADTIHLNGQVLIHNDYVDVNGYELNVDDCGEDGVYFHVWKQERFESFFAGGTIDELENSILQDSYTGDIVAGKVNINEARDALETLTGQNPGSNYLGGIVWGYPECIGTLHVPMEGRNDCVNDYFGWLNSCMSQTWQTTIAFDMIVEDTVTGECRRIESGAYPWSVEEPGIQVHPWDLNYPNCQPYPDTAIVGVRIRFATSNSGSNTQLRADAVLYHVGSTYGPQDKEFFIQAYDQVDGWGEARAEFHAVEQYGSWQEIKDLMGLGEHERIKALARKLPMLQNPHPSTRFKIGHDRIERPVLD